MKWSIIYILLAVLTMGNLRTIEGGTQTFNLARDPFYTSFNTYTCDLILSIQHPRDNQTVYTNQVDINYSFNDAPHTCRYRIIQDETFAWNNIPCNGSITRTLTQGYQTLEINIISDTCDKTAKVNYYVWSHSNAVGPFDPIFYLPFAVLIYIILFNKDCKGQLGIGGEECEDT